jgi:hypothetical protein
VCPLPFATRAHAAVTSQLRSSSQTPSHHSAFGLARPGTQVLRHPRDEQVRRDSARIPTSQPLAHNGLILELAHPARGHLGRPHGLTPRYGLTIPTGAPVKPGILSLQRRRWLVADPGGRTNPLSRNGITGCCRFRWPNQRRRTTSTSGDLHVQVVGGPSSISRWRNWDSVWESGPFAPATVERRYLPDEALPRDFDVRLGDAFSSHIWPLLNNRSCRGAFSRGEPVRLLSQQLDFWPPYIDLLAQRRAATSPRSLGMPTTARSRRYWPESGARRLRFSNRRARNPGAARRR